MSTVINQNERQAIRVLVIHGNPLFRLGIRATLERHGMQIVGETILLEEVLDLVASQHPDVVLLDGTLTFCDAYQTYSAAEMVMHIRQADRRGVLVFVPSPDEANLFRFMMAGASAYELPTLTSDALMEKIQRVADGEYLISSEVLRVKTRAVSGRAQPKPQVQTKPRILPTPQAQSKECGQDLTSRNIEVLQCVLHGLTNKQIAKRLAISDQTVRNHLTRMLRILGMRDRTGALVAALRLGLITLSDALPSPVIPLRMEAQDHHATSHIVTPGREEVAV